MVVLMIFEILPISKSMVFVSVQGFFFHSRLFFLRD